MIHTLLRRRWCSAVLGALSIVCSFTRTAAAGEETGLVLTWESTATSASDVSRQFGELYAGMQLFADQKTLATRDVADPEGKPLRETLQSEQLYFGSYFPRELDVLTCTLNRKICTVTRAGKERVAKWRNKPGDTIRVPDLRFEPITTVRPYEKKAGMKIEDIVVKDRQGCQTFDEACRKYMTNLNVSRPGALEDSFEGEILVPTRNFRSDIRIGDTVADVTREQGATENPKPAAIKTYTKHISKSLSKNIVIRAPLAAWSLTVPEDAGIKRKDLLRLIHHPLADGKPIPTTPVDIAVLDGTVDAAHCDFSSTLCVHLTDSADCAPPGGGACGVFNPRPNPLDDHGTHVVSLIAARQDAALGPGVNPLARVAAFPVSFGTINDFESIKKLADRINGLARFAPARVVNLSMSYPFRTDEVGRNDPVEKAINVQRDVLFVVAAGNSSQEFTEQGACSQRPACLNRNNVISVVALESRSDGGLFAGSNFGSAFHIAAPGEKIVSSTSRGGAGAMSGTSQAAPLVTGAASLLFAKSQAISPGMVKNRLIYTSDFDPVLRGRVMGGRLNVARALDTDVATVEYEKDGVSNVMRGVPIFNNGMISIQHLQGAMSEELVETRRIRRLVRHADGRSFTILYTKPGNDNADKLTRSEVTLDSTTSTMPINVAPAGSPADLKSVPWREIEDYVSCFVSNNIGCMETPETPL